MLLYRQLNDTSRVRKGEIMDYINETRLLLGISLTQLADLFGVTYTEMSDIVDGTKQPSPKLLKSCKLARQIFLNKNDTLRVKGGDKMEKKNFDAVIRKHLNDVAYDADTVTLFEQTRELVTFLKTKGLTIRQAQLVLKLTSDFLLDEKLV